MLGSCSSSASLQAAQGCSLGPIALQTSMAHDRGPALLKKYTSAAWTYTVCLQLSGNKLDKPCVLRLKSVHGKLQPLRLSLYIIMSVVNCSVLHATG